MNHDHLLHLLDHPTPDADAPRNPVLTHHVMERVRHAAATQRIAVPDRRPWLLAVVLVTVIALAAPFTGMVSDGGLSEAAQLFDFEQVMELTVGALIAGAVLALSWRRTV